MSGAYLYSPSTPSSRQQGQICNFYFSLISGIGSNPSKEWRVFVMLSDGRIGQLLMFTFSYDEFPLIDKYESVPLQQILRTFHLISIP